jgi:hypothetical protein
LKLADATGQVTVLPRIAGDEALRPYRGRPWRGVLWMVLIAIVLHLILR